MHALFADQDNTCFGFRSGKVKETLQVLVLIGGNQPAGKDQTPLYRYLTIANLARLHKSAEAGGQVSVMRVFVDATSCWNPYSDDVDLA